MPLNFLVYLDSSLSLSTRRKGVIWMIIVVKMASAGGVKEVGCALTVRDHVQSSSSGALVLSSHRATGAPMQSKRSCVCFSQPSTEISFSALVSSEDWSTGNRNSHIFRGFRNSHLAGAKNEVLATSSYLFRNRKNLVLHDDLGRRDSCARLDGRLIFKGLALSSGQGGGITRTDRIKASSDTSSSQPASPASTSLSTGTTTTAPHVQQTGFLASILSFPCSLWRQVVLPLSNFGFGKTSIWEGGVGLFVISGAVLLAITLTWVKGTQLRSRSHKYEAVIEFARAQGITVGTPVRIRGVDVGSVVGMRPSLERIDVVVQLVDTGIVIPRNALVEVNQSGLISETLIDVTPRDPLPQPTLGPLDAGCSDEGLIVCDRERIKGEQGVSLDELVGICTKIAKQMDDLGMSNMYGFAERVTTVIDEAKPLLGKVDHLAGDVQPLLTELKNGALLKDLERLTKVVAEAGDDVRRVNKAVLTTENTELLRQSVVTLTKTLRHIESISQDLSRVTGNAVTKKNLPQLIESLSRLIRD